MDGWKKGLHRLRTDAWVNAQLFVQALKAAGKALELNPGGLTVRQFLVACHLRLGERAQAQKEFDTLVAMNPPQAEMLRRWFAEVHAK